MKKSFLKDTPRIGSMQAGTGLIEGGAMMRGRGVVLLNTLTFASGFVASIWAYVDHALRRRVVEVGA